MFVTKLTIDIIADFVCPWCYIGGKRLDKALKILEIDDAKIEWKPYQLDPTLPKLGRPYESYLKQRLGGADKVDEIHRQLIELGKEFEIEFDFAAIEIMPNTLDAHRVTYWAGQAESDTQTKVAYELFSRFFEQGQDIGETNILTDIAREAGMRGDVVEKLLETNVDINTMTDDITLAQKIGVQGVPCFIINKKYAIMGAQSTQKFADAIGQICAGFEPQGSEDR
ncbi:DsbA family oxidoreductase [Bartonella sp. HY406]|uniref:DsbA family oxidoreductase n=1 Tax=Bartonella sp. HY406 TaxID=2979331 RepID=UPI0021C9352B|nr:DsbA family oxidoreductase [Bartonella sp. HY406]UXN04551.1 DsbA family oxidoreductase [Bartonella sp. HY406]